MNLFDSAAPKSHENNFDIHPRVSDVFKIKSDELVPVFSDSEIIKSEKITNTYNPKNTLYHIKNFCSAFLNFYSNFEEMIKLDKTNNANYSSRFTHPINEIKFDSLEYTYIKVQEHLLSLYKYEEVDFNLYIVETESVMPIYDRISIKDDKYYIQPEVENIIKRLILSKIIPPKEVSVIDILKNNDKPKECLEKIDTFNQMLKLGINDYQQCYSCRFKIICLKNHHI